VQQQTADDDKNEQRDWQLQQQLRGVPDDPGGLLRRKFLYQYQQRQQQTTSDKPW